MDDELWQIVFQYCHLPVVCSVCARWNYLANHSIMLPHWMKYLTIGTHIIFDTLCNDKTDILRFNPHPLLETRIKFLLNLPRIKLLKRVASMTAVLNPSVFENIKHCQLNDDQYMLSFIFKAKIGAYYWIAWKETTRKLINECYPEMPRDIAFDLPINDIMMRLESYQKTKINLINPTKEMVLKAII